MERATPSIAIIGAGMGGLAAATLRQAGIDVTVYEQAPHFERFGAGIQMIVAADGLHSLVREIIIGPDMPLHKGRIAYRAIFSSALLNGFDIGRSRTKWWGLDRHIVIYYTWADRSELYFVTSVPEPAGCGECAGDSQGARGGRVPPTLTRESWSAKGDVQELRKAYEGFAARAIEDAAVPARYLEEVDGEDIAGAFQRYEAHRKPRTSRIQPISSANTWMKGDDDTSWLYGYDAWNVPLTPTESFAGTT